jgi:hypothetical protein
MSLFLFLDCGLALQHDRSGVLSITIWYAMRYFFAKSIKHIMVPAFPSSSSMRTRHPEGFKVLCTMYAVCVLTFLLWPYKEMFILDIAIWCPLAEANY